MCTTDQNLKSLLTSYEDLIFCPGKTHKHGRNKYIFISHSTVGVKSRNG